MLPTSPIESEIGKICNKARDMGILAHPSTLQDLYRHSLREREVEALLWRELNAATSPHEAMAAEERCRARCNEASTTLLLDLLEKQGDLCATGQPSTFVIVG